MKKIIYLLVLIILIGFFIYWFSGQGDGINKDEKLVNKITNQTIKEIKKKDDLGNSVAADSMMYDIFQTSTKEFKEGLREFLSTIYLFPYLTKDKYDIKIKGFLKEQKDLENSLVKYLEIDLIDREKKYKAIMELLHDKNTKKNFMIFLYFTNGELILPSLFWTGIDSEAMLIYQPKAKIEYYKGKINVFIETKLPAEEGEIHQKWIFFNVERSCDMDVIYPTKQDLSKIFVERE